MEIRPEEGGKSNFLLISQRRACQADRDLFGSKKIQLPGYGNTSSAPLLFPELAVMHPSSLNSYHSSLSSSSAARDLSIDPAKVSGDRHLWELLHWCDHHESDVQEIAQQGLIELGHEAENASSLPVTVGSPDWVFVCDQWDPRSSAALIFRGKDLVASIQKREGQLRLSTFDFLSARLIEALFELGVDARVEEGMGELFWKRAETVAWRHGLGPLGYTMEAFSADLSAKSELEEKSERLDMLSNTALPNACTARQLRILYKYG